MNDQATPHQLLTQMKRADFETLPTLGYGETPPEFDSLVIIPEKYYHDSGYRCMSFALCKGNEALCKTGGSSDVVHIDGIGGIKPYTLNQSTQVFKLGKGWSIDCLPKSGLLRLFCHRPLECGSPLSSFEVWSKVE